ncbi:MAG: FAD-binding protein, partial [Acidimicrobiales bacterium]
MTAPPGPAGSFDAVEEAAQLLGATATRGTPLGPLTTYRVGGPAALFVELADEACLEVVARAVSTSGVAVLVVGKGSNLLVSEAGFAGLAVRLGGGFNEISTEGDLAEAGGAVSYPVLARRSAAASLTGMEWAVGIPGSVGGAVRMNAGGHGAETKDRLASARVLDLAGGDERRLSADELSFSYRHSSVGASQV